MQGLKCTHLQGLESTEFLILCLKIFPQANVKCQSFGGVFINLQNTYKIVACVLVSFN